MMGLGGSGLGDLLKTIVGAGLGTFFMQALLTLWRDGRQRGSSARYMAMRLAVMLEAFAGRCADMIAENDNAIELPDEEYPQWITALPELPEYPTDSDGWRAIDGSLATRCLEFRNRIEGSQGLIRSTCQSDEDGMKDQIDRQAAERGMEAWHLAVDMRRENGLPKVDLVWDFTSTLNSAIDRVDKSKRDRLERSAASMQALAARFAAMPSETKS
jgi:hypothetical protein